MKYELEYLDILKYKLISGIFIIINYTEIVNIQVNSDNIVIRHSYSDIEETILFEDIDSIIEISIADRYDVNVLADSINPVKYSLKLNLLSVYNKLKLLFNNDCIITYDKIYKSVDVDIYTNTLFLNQLDSNISDVYLINNMQQLCDFIIKDINIYKKDISTNIDLMKDFI